MSYHKQDPTISTAECLARLARLWRMVADIELSPFDMTYSRWSVLWKLYRMGDNISQKELAMALEIELASLMRTLGKLEQQGFIERHGCPDDKRVRRVSLTVTGTEFLESVKSRVFDIRTELFSGVSSEDMAVFEAVIQQISDNAYHKLHSIISTDVTEKDSL